jgi:hypothetical protein
MNAHRIKIVAKRKKNHKKLVYKLNHRKVWFDLYHNAEFDMRRFIAKYHS